MSADSFPGARAPYAEGDELKSIPFGKNGSADEASVPLLRDPGVEIEDRNVPEYDYSAPTIFFHYSSLFNSEGDFYAGAADLFRELHSTRRYRLCVVKPSFDETFRILSSKEEKMNTHLKQQIGNAQYGLLMPFSPTEELSTQEQYNVSIGFMASHTNAIFIHPSVINPLDSLYETLSQHRFPMHSIRFMDGNSSEADGGSSPFPEEGEYGNIRYAFFNHKDHSWEIKKCILVTCLSGGSVGLNVLSLLMLLALLVFAVVCAAITATVPPVLLFVFCGLLALFVLSFVLAMVGMSIGRSMNPHIWDSKALKDFVAENPLNEEQLANPISSAHPSGDDTISTDFLVDNLGLSR